VYVVGRFSVSPAYGMEIDIFTHNLKMFKNFSISFKVKLFMKPNFSLDISFNFLKSNTTGNHVVYKITNAVL
jgi:accessory gene regulator protein AgrB